MIDINILQKDVRDEFSKLFENDKDIEAIFKKLKTGKATYSEAQLFAEKIGELLRQSFETKLTYLIPGTELDVDLVAEEIVEKMLTQNFKLSALVCDVVQDNLNKAAGLGINPKAPKLNESRIAGISTLVKEATDQEKLKAALGENIVNYSQACVDEWVSENASFQARLGMDPVIVRKWSGSRPSHDTKGTDWCEELAGVYHYKDGKLDGPSAVFARHKGCRCTVEYFPEGSTTGKITALQKGEKDTNKVLWNTGKVTSYSRDAVLRRRRQEFGKEEARKILNEEWKGGLNGNAERHF